MPPIPTIGAQRPDSIAVSHLPDPVRPTAAGASAHVRVRNPDRIIMSLAPVIAIDAPWRPIHLTTHFPTPPREGSPPDRPPGGQSQPAPATRLRVLVLMRSHSCVGSSPKIRVRRDRYSSPSKRLITWSYVSLGPSFSSKRRSRVSGRTGIRASLFAMLSRTVMVG